MNTSEKKWIFPPRKRGGCDERWWWKGTDTLSACRYDYKRYSSCCLFILNVCCESMTSGWDIPPRTTTTITGTLRDHIRLIRLLPLIRIVFNIGLQILFYFPFLVQILMDDKWLLFLLRIGPLFICFAGSEQAHYRTIIPPLLADWMALLPTATAERGIRLPRQLSGCTAGLVVNIFYG